MPDLFEWAGLVRDADAALCHEAVGVFNHEVCRATCHLEACQAIPSARRLARVSSRRRTRHGCCPSARLRAMLETRHTEADSQHFEPDAYVFGNEVGERITWIR